MRRADKEDSEACPWDSVTVKRLGSLRAAARRGFSAIELLTSVAVISALMALILPAVQSAREQARIVHCKNNLKQLGLACYNFHDVYGYFPRNTIRPRGTTQIGAEPPGSPWHWDSGSFESWPRELLPFIEQPGARSQDAIPVLGCPTDPRGPAYTVPDYGFTWYVGVYSNPDTANNGILCDDTERKSKSTVSAHDVTDGLSQTLLLAERPPDADGEWSWWDSRCCIEDTISPIRGRDHPYSSGAFGGCPKVSRYRTGRYDDDCMFNSVWSNHRAGGNFCMGDGSVRTISYESGNTKVTTPEGETSLLEAMASRCQHEVLANPP